MDLNSKTIAIIGLGYVGLPLAVEFGKKRPVIGFDIHQARITELQGGSDHTLECSSDELKEASHLQFSADASDLYAAQIYIVTVPTPVDNANRPDMTPLIKASETVGKVLKVGDVVIYESTVFPGATEEICVPILERLSNLKFNSDFFCGYSPERINPGDKEHRLPTIKKVTSGSTPEAAVAVDKLYGEIVTAGTYMASSIKVAEAAKVIENTQRDLNIALMNELSLIFHHLGIDTLEVLQAAGTKWNFLPFRPGLVGGHCIGVDPYYLTHKAQEVGYHPEVILAGRRINDSMAGHVADSTVKLMLRKGKPVLGSRVLVLGLTFKENCPDVRNTKVVDIVKALKGYNCNVDVYDPWIDVGEAFDEYGLQCLRDKPETGGYAGIILAVGHEEFVALGEEGIKAYGEPDAVLFDVKGILPMGAADGRL
ncbi:Vi polysaccharide biosynthesis UDP-N-acetylglucosamine C-6 dehydrogenase TviB [Pseudomonas phytophila]|uniref:Vi polysaccharide biosynthesis UDP-N-acetylglucosamine C-6 dehydrogenase TviB n=1 Tax=Pseudomonas phytophila TaxID=2867264 RepID=A0ABY6FAX2_9PSED|nr:MULTISPECIES: Vi polysaccharide biosynthesis UDP-N-acetylglucosamine C-6 dehydrogenase TviB [Pseudomonas]MCD5971703.1 Vi polysaccharide biosynthesis UDP-N-acetylglucosamine C-6 dehydrogenase TviB [Pseudomonas quasicaspiana]UXZ95014.1 Vi polysaccharide biosynthesis UDP-N-acetylglucosamine C-6 dehydrogenase TviB [Pseudomonas phytophila]